MGVKDMKDVLKLVTGNKGDTKGDDLPRSWRDDPELVAALMKRATLEAREAELILAVGYAEGRANDARVERKRTRALRAAGDPAHGHEAAEQALIDAEAALDKVEGTLI